MRETAVASVIIPVYNAEAYLADCLESIQKQTYTHFNAVLIDDGSTDSSSSICEQWAARDQRFKVYHQKNQGVSAARNAGLDHASGDFIFWIDADDYADSHLIEKAVHVLEKEKADIVLFQNYTFNQKGIQKKSHPYHAQDIMAWRKEAVKGDHGVLWGMAVPRSMWEGLRFDTHMTHSGEDGIFTLKLIYQAKKIAFVNEPLYYHRINEQGLSHSHSSRKYFGNFLLWQERLRYGERDFPKLADYCRVRLLSNAVKAGCLSLALHDISEEESKTILHSLDDLHSEGHRGRLRDEILSWALRYHQEWLCQLYVKHKLGKSK